MTNPINVPDVLKPGHFIAVCRHFPIQGDEILLSNDVYWGEGGTASDGAGEFTNFHATARCAACACRDRDKLEFSKAKFDGVRFLVEMVAVRADESGETEKEGSMNETIKCECGAIYDEICNSMLSARGYGGDDISMTFTCPKHGQVTIDDRPIPPPVIPSVHRRHIR